MDRSRRHGPVVVASVGAVVAALVVSGAMVYGSSVVASAIREASGQLEEIQREMGRLELSSAPQPAVAAPTRRAPDGKRRYAIDLGGAPLRGSEDAEVTIIEYSDFQCPFCARVHPTLERILEEYEGEVRLAFKHFPLDFHAKAPEAHAAAVAAGRQGKFWEMHDKIFANQRVMGREMYEAWALELGLDLERFRADLESADVHKVIQADKDEGASLGITGTPSFFINGRYLSGAQPYDAFKAAVERELDT